MTTTPNEWKASNARPDQTEAASVPLVFLATQAIFVAWIIAGIVSTSHPNCGSLDADTCASANAAGQTIGVGLIIGLWMAVDVIMGVTYLIMRSTRKAATS